MAWRVFILGLTLALAGCATTPPSPDAMEVDDLVIEGEKELKEADLKEKIVTGESSWLPPWVPFFGRLEWFDPVTWQADLRRIQRFYEANGYYQARVLSDVVTEVRPKHVKLLVKLREGEPARVNTVDILGLEALPPEMQADVVKSLPLSTGDIFLEDSWARTKALLSLRLRELGFAEVAVTGEALVDAEAARVDISLDIVTGTRFRFGKLFVATDPGAQVPAKLIADQASPDFPEGAYFSESAMAAAQARVFQMGVFAGVKVNRGIPDRAEGTVPVVIDVKEAPFHSLRFGGGLGGDLIRQEVRVVGEYTDRNLGLSRIFFKNARLDRLTLKAKLGIAFLPNVIDVFRATSLSDWGPVWRGYAEYEVPRLGGIRTLSLQGSVDVLRTLDNTYSYDAVEAKVGVIWRPRIDLNIFPSLNLNTFLLHTALELRDTVPAAAINCPQAPQLCLVGFFDLNVELDRRDNRLEAKQGFYLALDTAVGLASTTRLRPFLKVTPEARGYVSFGKEKQFTFAARAKFGTLLAPENDTPIVVRYFSGGAGMRGFQQRRLSPQIAVLTRDDLPVCPSRAKLSGPDECPKDATTLPIGGSGLLEGALELRWSFSENWVLALFNDWGLVTEHHLFAGKDWSQSLYTAVGFGVRYRTPLGPIRVDLAFRMPLGGPQQVTNTTSTGGTVEQFRSAPGCFFGAGSGNSLADPYSRGPVPSPYAGSPDGLCSAHLSIGEAF
ncbi:MAG: BamA/TamA family outer membrane protein [Archangium sp.]|nr:BamA/TamA family outer membrane protein [Archangium sp.]